MRRLALSMVLALGALLAGCAEGVPFNQAAVPSVPANAGRIYLYRDPSYTQGLAWVRVFLNGENVGAVGPGQVILRDVAAPGIYTIAPASQGLWPNQNKTVAIQPGQSVYAKIQTIRGINPSANRPQPQFTYVVVLQRADIGRAEINNLQLMGAGSLIARFAAIRAPQPSPG